MRIAVVEFAARGGLVHYAFQLCRALARAGAEVTLVTGRSYELDALPAPFRVEKLLDLWDPKPPGEARPAGALVRRLRRAGRALRYYREWVRLAGWLRRERPDAVLFGDVRFPTDLVGLAALKRLGLRLADVCHNVRPFVSRPRARLVHGSPLVRFLLERVYRRFDAVFVHFESNRRAFLATFAVDPARVGTIVHGNQALFAELAAAGPGAEGLRRDLGLDKDAPVVLLLGTLTRYKGVDLLLEAFPGVLRREPRAFLVVAGFPAPDFDLAAERERARRLGLLERVRFAPRYLESAEVRAWMDLAGVVVFPYRWVYQSGAVLVAMTLGRPVVATAVGAMPEVIEDGASGLLAPPGDAAALGEAVLRVLLDPDLARRLGEGAARAARERFAWERVAAAVLARLDAGGAPR